MDPRIYTSSLGGSEQPSPSLSAPQSYSEYSHRPYESYSYVKESAPVYTSDYPPLSYRSETYTPTYLKEAPKSAALPYTSHESVNLTSLLGSYTTTTPNPVKTEFQAVNDISDPLRQSQGNYKSYGDTLADDGQNKIKSLQADIDHITKLKNVEVSRVRQEKDDLEFQRNALREDSERLTKKNEELRTQVDQLNRTIERNQKQHDTDLEKFKQLYDEIIRNISEEKKRAINQITAEYKEKGSQYGTSIQTPSEFGSVTTRSEPQEKVKSSYRRAEDVVQASEDTGRLTRELSEIKVLLAAREKDLELEKSIRQEIEAQREKQMKLVGDLEKEVHLLRQRAEVTSEGENKVDIDTFKRQENERAQKYEERIKELEETVTRLTGLTTAHDEVHSKENKEGELREELNKLREYVASLEAKVKSEEGRTEGEQQETGAPASVEQLERQKSKRREYKKQLTAAKDELEKGQKEKDEISQKLQELEQELENWNLIEEDRKKMLKEAQEAVEVEKKQREEASLKLSDIEGKIENLRGKKKEYKTQLSQVQEKFVAGQQEKDTVSDKAREYEQEIERQNARLEEYQKIIAEAQDLAQQEKQNKEEIAARISTLEETVNKYKGKKKAYKTKLSEVQAGGTTEAEKTEVPEDYQRELAEAREKNEHLASDLKALQENVQKMEKLLENHKQIEENYEKTLVAVRAEAEEAKRRNEEISGKEAALEERANKQGAKKKDYKKQLSDVQEKAVQEQEKVRKLEEELERLKENQNSYENELSEAKKRVEEENHSKAHLLSTKEDYEKELEETKQSFAEAVEREKNLLNRILEFEQTMKESLSWSEKYREIEGKYKAVETELENAKNEIDKKEFEVEKFKQEALQKGGHLEQTKTSAEKTVEKLKEELSGAQEAQNKERQRLEERIQELEKELGGANKGANKEEGKQSKKVNQIENEKKQLENNLKEVTNEKNKIETQLKKELEEVQNKLKEAEKKVEEAEKSRTAAAEDEKNGFVTRDRGSLEKTRQTHEVEGSRFARLNESEEVPKKQRQAKTSAPATEEQHDQEKEELRKKLTEVDAVYGQKIQEMENELASREQHINALKYDVEQMKEWIVVRHGDEVFEADSHNNLDNPPNKPISNDEKYEILGSAGLSEKAADEIAMRNSMPVKSAPLETTSQQRQGKKNKKNKQNNLSNLSNLSLNWKGRLEDSNILYVPKKDSLNISTSEMRLSEARGNETPRSVKTTVSLRTPESTRKGGNRREREGGPVHAQLEKMILELNEKLANSDKKHKADLTQKIHQLSLEFQQKEEKHAEEIEKMKEEKKVLEEKLSNIQWEHAYELNNLLMKEKAEREALVAKQQVETAPGQGKKKKKKGNQVQG